MKVERLEIGEMKNWRKEKVDILGFLRCSPKANYFAKREGLKNEEGQQYLTFFQLTAKWNPRPKSDEFFQKLRFQSIHCSLLKVIRDWLQDLARATGNSNFQVLNPRWRRRMRSSGPTQHGNQLVQLDPCFFSQVALSKGHIMLFSHHPPTVLCSEIWGVEWIPIK